LVSVRSGSAVSMPGMMDTLLNCGLHPGLADDLGNPPEFWPLYTQFILMFARTVAGLPAQAFRVVGADPHHATRHSAEACLGIYCEKTSRPFPMERA
jgi:pyruvate,orthophosphate dikinase